MMQYDTIAAIATPLGQSGIGVIRLSGAQARQIASRVFRAANQKALTDLAGYSAAYGKVYDGETQIDEAIALVFIAPKSYTGEDVVELSVHGGRYILKRLLRALVAAGARLAEAGEFTKRAFLNGKLDLIQAESIIGLIGAHGAQDLKLALSARVGATSKQVEAVRAKLLEIASDIAAYSDYPDEDIPALSESHLSALLSEAETGLAIMLQEYDAGRVLREGIDTVIVGRPNVGKSTLMNLLSGQDRSIVTPVAGTTRDVIEETVQIGDILLRLADTAGLRETDDAVEAVGVGLASKRLENAQLALAVFDASEPLEEADRALMNRLADKPCVFILNKTDLNASFDETVFANYPWPVVSISAKDGTGLPLLAAKISEVTGVANLNPDAAVLCSERQHACAQQAFVALKEAESALQSGLTLDAVGVCVDDALAALFSLVGERVTEAVTEEVFARFCVGK